MAEVVARIAAIANFIFVLVVFFNFDNDNLFWLIKQIFYPSFVIHPSFCNIQFSVD